MNNTLWEFTAAIGLQHPEQLDAYLTPRQQREALRRFQYRPFGPHAQMRMLARLMYVAATLAGATKAREEDFIPWPKERTERAEERKHQVDEAKNVSVNLGAFE